MPWKSKFCRGKVSFAVADGGHRKDQIDDIRKCGISCLKLHGELPSEQLHDVGAGKFQILTCSPESLHEGSVREQFLKLQKNIVCMAVDEAHCVLQW